MKGVHGRVGRYKKLTRDSLDPQPIAGTGVIKIPAYGVTDARGSEYIFFTFSSGEAVRYVCARWYEYDSTKKLMKENSNWYNKFIVTFNVKPPKLKMSNSIVSEEECDAAIEWAEAMARCGKDCEVL